MHTRFGIMLVMREVMRSPAVFRWFSCPFLIFSFRKSSPSVPRARTVREHESRSISQPPLSHSASCHLFHARRNACLCTAVFVFLRSRRKRASSRRLRARQPWSRSPLRCQALSDLYSCWLLNYILEQVGPHLTVFWTCKYIFLFSPPGSKCIFLEEYFWCPLNIDAIQNTV